LVLGNETGAGTYSLSGTGVLSSSYETVGWSGSGSFVQSGGTNMSSSGGNLVLGYQPGGSGSYVLSGSGALVQAFETIGWGGGGSGAFTQSGGTNSVSNLYLSNSSNSSYILAGGLLRLGNLYESSGPAVFDFSGGTFQSTASFSDNVPISLTATGSGAVFDTGGNTLTLAAAVSGSGSLTKIGAGVLILSGTNTFGGGMIVMAGELVLTDPAAAPNGSNVTVGNPGTFDPLESAETSAASASPNGVQGVPEPSAALLLAAGTIAIIAVRAVRFRR
jgi:fibronectin-binding autotransporter adhesin